MRGHFVVATTLDATMATFTILDNAINHALVMAARGQRPWRVERRADGWRVRGDDSDAPDVFGTSTTSRDVVNAIAAPECKAWVAYPSGLVQPIDCVNWVWWIEEERKYRQGSAIQAEKYAQRKGYQSPLCVDPDVLHGSQAREDRPYGYVFVPSLSFPSWTQERY